MAEVAPVWLAPAKINLFLHVVGRRPDGYHLLQTVFQFIDRCDELRFKVRADGAIRRTNDLPGVSEQHDLSLRAAMALKTRFKTRLGVEIELIKRIPIGGGLGGGSSDAATALLALNRLWELNVSLAELVPIGLALGADVAVFLSGRAAWAEGIGDLLTPIEPPTPWILVVDPGCSVSTAEVFNHPALTRQNPPIKMTQFLVGDTTNHCAPVVCELFPAVAEALEWLNKFGHARLSGTGSCAFAPFPIRADADAVLRELPSRWTGFVARSMNRHPHFNSDARSDFWGVAKR